MRKTTHAKYQQIYEFLIKYKREFDGNSPTYRQIAEACDISTLSLVANYLQRMEILGMIKRSGLGKFCNISIPGAIWLPPPHIQANAELESGQWQKQEAKRLEKLLGKIRANRRSL